MKNKIKVFFTIIFTFVLASYIFAQNKLALEKDTTIENVTQVDSIFSNKNIEPQSFPVMGFFNDTLVLIYNKLGSFTAKDRAIAISERINKLKDDFSFDNTSLKVVETETTFDIVNGENIIMSVSQKDALSNNSTKEELAELYRKKITDAVVNYKNETSYSTLLKDIAQAFLVFIVLILLIYFISKLFRSFSTKISNQEGSRFHDIKIKNYTLIEASKQIGLITSILNFFKWIIIILLINISLPIIFSFFPWTQPYAKNLFSYVINPIKLIAIKVWHYLPNLITIIIIYIIFKYVLKVIRFLKNEIEEGKLQLSGFYPDWANPTFQILRVLLYAFMFVLMFPYLPGSDSPIFQGVSVFLGFLFTFGSSSTLSNTIAGIVLTYMRLYKIGDRVKIGEVVGDVIEKTSLVTRVKTTKNEIISIPNSTVMNSHTINYSNEAETGNGLIMYTTVTIGYDVPWKDMHQALLNAADRTNLLLKEPKPFVLQTSLEDFYVSYQINAYTREPNKQAGIYSDLHQNIQDCCNEVGIEILSPHYRAGRDGNMTTIPSNYLDKNYKAPSFNIKIDNTGNGE